MYANNIAVLFQTKSILTIMEIDSFVLLFTYQYLHINNLQLFYYSSYWT